MRGILTVVAIVAVIAGVGALSVEFWMPRQSDAQEAQVTSTKWKTAWTYEGPRGAEHWGDLDPDYVLCKTGREQSPINIQDTQKSDLPPLRFEYKSGPLNIINNGYTAVRVDYTHSGDFFIVGDQRYELKQFHFHRPSEEYVHGKQYDMVLHLMHSSSDGRVAGVAVLLEAGRTNPTVEQLWKYMPRTAGDTHLIPGVEVTPATLLPRELGYYTYMGSQTAPPCTEGVMWFVLKSPVEVSAQQIDAFAKLYPNNARPLQPLNGRVAKESK